MALPGGGLSSAGRLHAMIQNNATALCCTPTYSLRLAEVAAAKGIDLKDSSIETIIVAGEPGGSIPSTRQRIETAWNGARVFDHHGLTEVGPVSYENPKYPGLLHIIESAFIAEVLDPETGQSVEPGETGELILTNLGRTGSPLLRYRTGDIVLPTTREPEDLGTADLALQGGILGRADDMVVVRSVNVFPSAIEEVVRSQEGIAEYQVKVTEDRQMVQLHVMIEPATDCNDPQELTQALQVALQTATTLRIPVALAEPGSLPRYEMKAKRWIRD